ncbi:MAG: hypothetical protein IT341_10485 [Chloroflexi bacterium]|nr:hypothetical protein [Chloroflexota bacterium]
MTDLDTLIDARRSGDSVDELGDLRAHAECLVQTPNDWFEPGIQVCFLDDDSLPVTVSDAADAAYAALACFAHDTAEYIALFGGPGE